MFDAKIQQIVDKFGITVDEKLDIFYDMIDEWTDRYEDLSFKMKIVIGVSLGLSVADTILLFAILVKLGR